MKVASIAQRLASYAVVIRPSDVVVQMAAIGIGVRRYYNIAIRRETAREFHTGEVC